MLNKKRLTGKSGLKWDAATISSIGIDELDQESFDIFRREALRSGRMSVKRRFGYSECRVVGKN